VIFGFNDATCFIPFTIIEIAMSRKKSALGIFSDLFVRIRKIRGSLTQVEFAQILGVAQGTINKYESGAILPGEDVLKKIADHGGVTVTWLLHGDKPAIPETITIESPPPGSGPGLRDPYLFHGVDINAMTQILEMTEDFLSQRRKPLKPVKKALLISLLYDQFQSTGQPLTLPTLKEILRRVE
jgi:transcriptional regulator with XRE-family HTH domain